jgi:HEAT repeat protein
VEGLIPIVAAAIGLSVAYLVGLTRRRAQMAAWELTARRNELTGVTTTDGSMFGGAALEADAGPLHVRLESYRRGRYEHGTRIVVSGLGHGPGSLTLRRESLATAFEKNVAGEREVELGDAAFDEQVFVRGQAPTAFAALGPQVRGRLARLLGGHVDVATADTVAVAASLADGRLEVRVREQGFSSRNRTLLPAIVHCVLAIARPLVLGADLARQIAANVEKENDPGVRLGAIATLAREFPGHPATLARLRAGLADPSDEVRLRAAAALGDEGRETLLELVTRAADDSCVARAISALGARLAPELAEATLRRALAAGTRRETALACLEQLREHGRPEAAEVVVQALGREDDSVAEAAARTLGRIGNVAAVEPLLAASRRGRRGVYRQAVAEIQARLPGAGAGQLSIAAGDAGALSLAEGDPGRLSLASTLEAATPTEPSPAHALPPPPTRERQ